MARTQTNNDNVRNGRGTILNPDKIDPFAADGQEASDDGIPPKDNGKIDPFAADGQEASDGGGNPPNDDEKSSARNWNTGEMILNRYQVVELLGQGGMGVVYRCRDTVGNVDVAVKALPTEVSHSTTEMEAVRENYNLVSTLVHTNIAVYKTLEKDKATGDYYLVMEYVGGEDLRHWMKRMRRENKLTLETALPVLRQIAEALDYAHKQDVIHRDVKPDNVKILADGSVKVLDFGLAAQIRTSQAHVSKDAVAHAGTNLYKSPEQWQGRSRQGAAADQYSLAVTAYELLSGYVPFEDDDMKLLKDAVLNDKPETIEGLPKYANVALMAGLAKDASGRYASCMDFVRALGGEKVSPKGCGADGKKKDKRMWLGIAAAVVVLAVGLVYVALDRQSANPPLEQPKVEIVEAIDDRPKQEEVKPDDKVELPKTKELEPASYINVPGDYYGRANQIVSFFEKSYDKGWNSGQTFGVHKDNFEKEYNVWKGMHDRMGYQASQDQYDETNRHLTAAEKERDWLVASKPLREEAASEKGKAETAKQKAEGENPAKYVPNEWRDANAKLQDADKQFEEGKFEEAKKGFTAANAAFQNVQTNAKKQHAAIVEGDFETALKLGELEKAQREVDKLRQLGSDIAGECQARLNDEKEKKVVNDLLKVAREAEDKREWQTAFDKASELLKKKPDHHEAQEIKRRAEGNLHPVVSFKAMAGDREVNASFHVDGGSRTYWTRDARFDWMKGQTYNLVFEYEAGGEKWESSGSVMPNRNGPISYTVALKKKPTFNGTVTLPGGVELKMVKVEKGSFQMGSNDGDGDEKPVHKVTLTQDFWLGETELTQSQYEAVMGKNPSSFKKGGNYPVECVSWYDAMAFCRKLTELERSAGRIPSGYEYSLPTEAQWEYAARGGNKSKGYEYSGGDNLGEVGWYYENSGRERLDDNNWKAENLDKLDKNGCSTHPVRQKNPNELGLYDMSGNVWEWCRDSCEWKDRVVTDTYRDGVVDPWCRSGSDRVSRGGAWGSNARLCRSANRCSDDPSGSYCDYGFRLALAPVQ
ncbi:MAG: SUMF1/EgtB/PvdO family nonheme iron enzyme [Lentisphaeria bacterium]|nr:SUMF1/EgtB/PvdO family nonheme iron enzyme [Lentisphaeria bacterium]